MRHMLEVVKILFAAPKPGTPDPVLRIGLLLALIVALAAMAFGIIVVSKI